MCVNTSSQMCQQHGADGLCTASANGPAADGRAVNITQRSSLWSFSTLCLCSGLAVALVPAVGVFSWVMLGAQQTRVDAGQDTAMSTKKRAIIVSVLCTIVLCVCFVYALVQFFLGAKSYAVGYGRCASLATFPDTLVPMIIPTRSFHSSASSASSDVQQALLGRENAAAHGPGDETYAIDYAAAFVNGGPVYVSQSKTYYCYCVLSAPADVGWNSANGSSSFVLTDNPPPSSPPSTHASFSSVPQVNVLYMNDITSPPLLDVSSAGFSGPVLYSGFHVPPGAAYLPDVAFCGKLGNMGSSCGADASVCACAPTTGPTTG